MFDWFEKLIVEIIWKAIDDAFNDLASSGETEIKKKLAELKAGEQLSTSPLVKVLAVDNAADTLTFLVRGPFSLGGGITPFMRLEVVISRSDVHLTGGDPPIRVLDWRSVVGALAITMEKVFDGNLGFGYDKGAWLGQGALKIVPLKLGAAIYGGFSDQGMVLGLDALIPPGAAIPLGPSGLALRGLGGDFAHNFVARLEKDGMPIATPTAIDYVKWARDSASIDRWKAGPIDKTAVGVGVRTVICTLADQGFVFELNPIGFAFLTPGGALLLGGKGQLLRRKGFGVEGYFAIDFATASLALGLGVNVEIKAPPDEIEGFEAMTLLKGTGQLDMFFSFSDPTAWFFDLGTEATPVKLEVLTDVPAVSIIFSEKAEAYFRINHHRIAFGASVAVGGSFKIGEIIELTARLAAAIHAYIGWDPLLIRAKIEVLGELGIKVWKIGFLLTGKASPMVYLPSPTLFKFEVSFKLDLPWPVPDVEGKKAFGDDVAEPPAVTSPLLAGGFTIAGAPTKQKQTVAAIHTVTERQWALDTEKPWPDLVLVVPFSRRVGDTTGKITPPVIAFSAKVPGGYDIAENVHKLEIFDLVKSVPVTGVTAVWVNGPGVETALLHVLGLDPFSWLTPHVDVATTSSWIGPRVFEVNFGYGGHERFTTERRFGDLFVSTASGAELITWFQPHLPTRLLQAQSVVFRFRDSSGQPFPVDQVTLFLVGYAIDSKLYYRGTRNELRYSDPAATVTFVPGGVVGGLNLVAMTIDMAKASDVLAFTTSLDAPVLIYAVRYRAASQSLDTSQTKTLLVPGRYRLTVEGKTTAIHPEFSSHPELYPSAPAVDWSVTQDFEVTYPETLRPYIFFPTFGDVRLFQKKQHPWLSWTASSWNPALFGFGFPMYRQYHVVVRFLVPFIGPMFSSVPLKLRLAFEKGGTAVHTVPATPTPDGTSSLLPESQAWITAAGGTVPPDAEIVVSVLPAETGTAALSLFFDHPDGSQRTLDEWTGYVSRFYHFRDHLAWAGTSITVHYNAAGRHERPACYLLQQKYNKPPTAAPFPASGIDGAVVEKSGPSIFDMIAKDEWVPIDVIEGVANPYPKELASAPADWRLAAGLRDQLAALDEMTGVRFARFAAHTGARFNAGGGDAVRGIQDTVAETTVQAVVDELERPYALWLRTPEPLDWRRVTGKLTIRHIEPATGCPVRFARRYDLELGVNILPGPDGSSAFLVGMMDGVATRLPRGECTLVLSFNPTQTGLPTLRPSAWVGAGPEVATLRFVQPLGAAWPSPGMFFPIQYDLFELLIKHVKFDPEPWMEAFHEGLPADAVEARLLESIQRTDALPAASLLADASADAVDASDDAMRSASIVAAGEPLESAGAAPADFSIDHDVQDEERDR